MDFGLLGSVEAWHGGLAMPVGGPHRRCVLAVLLLEPGRVVTVERLVELVWGESPPMAARNTVATHVSRLRRALGLGPEVELRATGAGYALRVDPDRVDLHRFRRLVSEAGAAVDPGQAVGQLTEALGLWRGPALAGLGGLRDRVGGGLDEERLAAIEQRLAVELRRGRHAAVVAELAELAAEHPLRERLSRLWLLALYRCDRPADALAGYRRLRDRMVSELGIEPGPALRELHRRILTNDPSLAAGPPPAPAQGSRPVPPAPVAVPTAPLVPTQAVRPAQLPADVYGFIGRAGELDALDQLGGAGADPGAGDSTAVPILVLSGTAGVGKSALAVHWAHRVRDRFPDGQLHVDLRGYDPDRPMTAGDALGRVLGALGIPTQDLPVDVNERAARFRTEVSDRRLLLVLDNAGSTEQVRPLLPGTPSCLVLVTSRDSLGGLVALHGARRIELDLLPEADAVELLARLVGDRVAADPAAARALAGQCARLPLAVRIAAEQAASRPAAPLSELVGELADRRRRLRLLNAGTDLRATIGAVFSWSYQHLDTDAARAFRLLGLHPGADLTVADLAALAGTDHETAHRLIGVLVRAHLLRPLPAGRFGMHDLLRAYAAELAADGSDDQAAALTGLLDQYLAAAVAAMNTVHPAERDRRPDVEPPPGVPLSDPAAARVWLDAERSNLAAACAHAATRGWPSHAVRLAATLYRYLEGGHQTEALAIHEHALRAATAAGDQAGQAHTLTNLGVVYRLLGRYEEAMAHQRRAIELHRGTGDRNGEARAMSNLAIVEERLGARDRAIERHVAALALYRELGDRYGQAAALTNLGGMLNKPDEYERGTGYLTEALALFRELGDRVGEASALSNLGEAALLQHRYPLAREHLARALTLFRDIGHRYGQATALSNLGEVCAHTGRHHDAIVHLDEALELFRRLGHRYGEASVLNGIAEALHAAGRPSDAAANHEAALAIVAETGDQDERIRALAGLARARDPGAGGGQLGDGQLGGVRAPQSWPAESAVP